jgi:hypothetical protein
LSFFSPAVELRGRAKGESQEKLADPNSNCHRFPFFSSLHFSFFLASAHTGSHFRVSRSPRSEKWREASAWVREKNFLARTFSLAQIIVDSKTDRETFSRFLLPGCCWSVARWMEIFFFFSLRFFFISERGEKIFLFLHRLTFTVHDPKATTFDDENFPTAPVLRESAEKKRLSSAGKLRAGVGG